MLFDIFRLLLVDARHRIADQAVCVQQLVEFGVDRLRVEVLGALDEQRHDPKTMVIERLRLKHQPGRHVRKDYQERQRMAGEDPRCVSARRIRSIMMWPPIAPAQGSREVRG